MYVIKMNPKTNMILYIIFLIKNNSKLWKIILIIQINYLNYLKNSKCKSPINYDLIIGW